MDHGPSIFLYTSSSMFTGIIEKTARVTEKTDRGLAVERPADFVDTRTGSSISINGVCLTVISLDHTSMRFDVIGETWNKTNLGSLQPGSIVNLERAMRADGRFEGHFVQGHIEGTARVLVAGTILELELPETLLPFVVPKGSITLNGVSLTVAELKKNVCTIALIPHTLQATNLGLLQSGDQVNIETDIISRTLWHFLHPQ